MTKKQQLFDWFATNVDYSAEYSTFMQAREDERREHPNSIFLKETFKDWLNMHANNYDVLNTAIKVAGYKNPQSDRTWDTAIKVYAEAGLKVI